MFWRTFFKYFRFFFIAPWFQFSKYISKTPFTWGYGQLYHQQYVHTRCVLDTKEGPFTGDMQAKEKGEKVSGKSLNGLTSLCSLHCFKQNNQKIQIAWFEHNIFKIKPNFKNNSRIFLINCVMVKVTFENLLNSPM